MAGMGNDLEVFLRANWTKDITRKVQTPSLDSDSTGEVSPGHRKGGLLSELLKDSAEIEQFESEIALETISSMNITLKEGSLSFQSHLNKMVYSEVKQLYYSMKENLLPYSFENFANYCVFSIVQRLEGEDRLDIIQKFGYSLPKMAIHNKSSIIVQYLVKNATGVEAKSIYSALKPRIVKLSKNSYGCYCLQYLLKKLPEEERNDMIKTIFTNISRLALHKKACSIVKESLTFEIEENIKKIAKQGILDNLDSFNQSESGMKMLKNLAKHLDIEAYVDAY